MLCFSGFFINLVVPPKALTITFCPQQIPRVGILLSQAPPPCSNIPSHNFICEIKLSYSILLRLFSHLSSTSICSFFGKSIQIAIPPLSKIACFISSLINILGLVSFFNKCFETIPIIGFLFNFILLPHCIIFSYCIFHRIFNTIYL